MLRSRILIALGSGLCAASLYFAVPAAAQPQPTGPGAGQPQPAPPAPVTPSLAVDPDQPGATPHWTITLGAAYCGGYRVGDGVYLSPEPPLALPSNLADGSTLFAGQPAAVDLVGSSLRIGPGPGLVLSMICVAGQRPLKVELLPEAGLGLPSDPGDYVVDVWTGADPTVMNLGVTVPTSALADP